MSTESICAVNFQPPRVAATDVDQQVNSAATGIAAVSADIWASYTADPSGNKTPPGKIWIELEAMVSTQYVRFCRTALAVTTVTNGSAVVVGTPRLFYVDPTKDLFLDVLAASAASSLKWRKVSPIGERARA